MSKTFQTKSLLTSLSYHDLNSQLQYKLANGYEQVGETKQTLNGFYQALVVKTMESRRG